MAWGRRRAEAKLQMRALKQALEESIPPDFVQEWIHGQTPDVHAWLSDLRFTMGGQPASVIMATIADQPWEMPDDVASALAESLAQSPQYGTDSNGGSYLLFRSSGGGEMVRLNALRATGATEFGSHNRSV